MAATATAAPTAPEGVVDPNADDNLALLKQQKAANSAPTTGGAPTPIPAPPPLPTPVPATPATPATPAPPSGASSSGAPSTAPAAPPTGAFGVDPKYDQPYAPGAPGAAPPPPPPAVPSSPSSPSSGSGDAPPPPPPPIPPGPSSSAPSDAATQNATKTAIGTLTPGTPGSGPANGESWADAMAAQNANPLAQYGSVTPTSDGYVPLANGGWQYDSAFDTTRAPSASAPVDPNAHLLDGSPAGAAAYAAANGQSGAQNYLEGGQSFSDLGRATDAMNAVNQQTASGGSAILAPQVGGAYTPAVQSYVDALDAQGVNPASAQGLTAPAPLGTAAQVSAGTPSGGIPGAAPATPPGTTASASGPSATAPSTASPIGPSATYTPSSVAIGTPILPNADPRLQSVQNLVNQAATGLGGVDRTQLAQQMFDTFAKSTDPAYKAATRQAEEAAAGRGQIGSGMLRTSEGNLANLRDQQLQNEQDSLMQSAEQGTIQDKLNNLGALSGLEGQQFGEQTTNNQQLDQQQQNQQGLDEQAYERALEQYQLGQDAQNNQFNQGVTLTELGDQGNPANYYAAMAAQLGMDPSAIAALAGQMGASSATSGGVATPSSQVAAANASGLFDPGLWTPDATTQQTLNTLTLPSSLPSIARTPTG